MSFHVVDTSGIELKSLIDKYCLPRWAYTTSEWCVFTTEYCRLKGV
jgi:hypothetical protein